MRIMRRFLHTWLTVIVAVCFGLNGYANDYKKEIKIQQKTENEGRMMKNL